MNSANETAPPYTRVYQDNDGYWYWQAIDSYGDAQGDTVGPFLSAVQAGRSAREKIVSAFREAT